MLYRPYNKPHFKSMFSDNFSHKTKTFFVRHYSSSFYLQGYNYIKHVSFILYNFLVIQNGLHGICKIQEKGILFPIHLLYFSALDSFSLYIFKYTIVLRMLRNFISDPSKVCVYIPILKLKLNMHKRVLFWDNNYITKLRNRLQGDTHLTDICICKHILYKIRMGIQQLLYQIKQARIFNYNNKIYQVYNKYLQ